MGGKKHLIAELKDFIEKLSEDFNIQNIILFGSRATNKFRENSDVDLIIVSEDFKNMDFFERGAKMYEYWDVDLPVDFICYTPKEFNNLKKKISIVKEALSSGIIVK
jgi:predicted nucleotidyltransferase